MQAKQLFRVFNPSFELLINLITLTRREYSALCLLGCCLGHGGFYFAQMLCPKSVVALTVSVLFNFRGRILLYKHRIRSWICVSHNSFDHLERLGRQKHQTSDMFILVLISPRLVDMNFFLFFFYWVEKCQRHKAVSANTFSPSCEIEMNMFLMFSHTHILYAAFISAKLCAYACSIQIYTSLSSCGFYRVPEFRIMSTGTKTVRLG